MKTGPLRAVVAAGCLVLLGCAGTSGRGASRDQAVRASLTGDFGLRGRLFINDLGQSSAVRLKASQARLDEGLLFLFDVHHRLHAIDREDLKSQWEFQGFEDAIRFPPTFNPTSVLAMSGNRLHSLDRERGDQRGGVVHFDFGPSAPFVATEGTAFVPAWGGSRGQKTIRTLNLVTGLEGWGYRAPGDIRGPMALGGTAPRQTVYFSTDAGEVYALPAAGADFAAPDPTWMSATHGPNSAGLVLDGDQLFVASEDRFLYAMDRITGRVLWATPLGGPLTEVPAVTAGSVYQKNNLGLHCLDRKTGAVRWTLAGAARFVVEREGKVVVQGNDGALWLVKDGGSVSVRARPGRFSYPTNTRDGTLYAVADDGYLVMLQVGGE